MAYGVGTRILSLFALMFVSVAASEFCVFPTEWSGTWIDLQYSSRNRVTFTRDVLTTKGRCIKSRPESGHYMLLKDAGEDGGPSCYYCIVFTRRTSNVLQYKEAVEEQMACPTNSDTAVNFDDVCNSIIVNNKLYTFIREDANPVACPFHGTYLFAFDYTHSHGCGGVCSQPLPSTFPTDQQSKAVSCASETQQLWTFVRRPCHPSYLPAVDNKKVQCLGHWRDGVDWMYIKYDADYRCVKFSSTFGCGHFLVSEDGICDAMFGGKSPLAIRFFAVSSTVTAASSATRCTLPKWTSDTAWTDLSRTMHIAGVAGRDELRQVALFPGGSRGQSQLPDATHQAAVAARNETLARYTCLSTQAGESFYMRAVEGCVRGCRCISMLWSPSGDAAFPQVVTMIRGPLEECSASPACPAAARHVELPDAEVWQLFDSSKTHSSCPFFGAFKAQHQGKNSSQDEVIYKFGCSHDQPATVVMETRMCSADSHRRSSCRSAERSLSCLATWKASERDVVVIGRRSIASTSATVGGNVSGSCYSYQIDPTTGTVHLISNVSCNGLLTRSMQVDDTLPLEIVLQPLRGSCGETETSYSDMSSVKLNVHQSAARCSRLSVSAILQLIVAAAQLSSRWLRPVLDLL